MMTFPTISAGTRANEAIGGYANFVAYCNALAAGVDSVTTTAAGAALKANNLSDLASASTARTNLGLGTAAVANTGTGASNVILGDDARLTDTRTPTDNTVATAKIVDSAVTDAKLASKKAPRTSLWLPGTSGNYASAPTAAAFGITGDLDIRWVGSLDAWVPAVRTVLVCIDDAYSLLIDTAGKPVLWGYNPSFNWRASSAAVGSANGVITGVRVTRSSAGVSFYTSADEGATWTQLGTTQSAISGSLATPAAALQIGARGGGGSTEMLAGRTLKAEVRSGVDGTIVASPDFTAPMGSRQRDAQGKVWTINGSAWAWEQA